MGNNLESLFKKLQTLPSVKKADSIKFESDEIIIRFKFPTIIRITDGLFDGLTAENFYAKGTKNKWAYGYLGEKIYTIHYEDTDAGWESIVNYITSFKD